MKKNYSTQLKNICINVANQLINMYPNGKASNLVFPSYRNGVTRVSEQESRVLFCIELSRLGWNYAVEVPTDNTYEGFTTDNPNVFFNKAKGRSAEVDLAIYEDNNKEVNIEFKSGQPNKKSVNKDFLKLCFEKPFGVWYHTLEKANSRSINAIVDKLNNGLQYSRKYNRKVNSSDKIDPNKKILVFMVILNNTETNKGEWLGPINIHCFNGKLTYRNRKLHVM